MLFRYYYSLSFSEESEQGNYNRNGSVRLAVYFIFTGDFCR